MSIDIGGWKGFVAEDFKGSVWVTMKVADGVFDAIKERSTVHLEAIAARANAILEEKLKGAEAMALYVSGGQGYWLIDPSPTGDAIRTARLVCIQPLIDAAERLEGGL